MGRVLLRNAGKSDHYFQRERHELSTAGQAAMWGTIVVWSRIYLLLLNYIERGLQLALASHVK